jgi:hypothetical protein
MKPLWKLEKEEDEPPTWTESNIISPAEIGETTDPALFYMESQLEDFLVENWDKTELGKNTT